MVRRDAARRPREEIEFGQVESRVSKSRENESRVNQTEPKAVWPQA